MSYRASNASDQPSHPEAERALRASERRYRDLIETMPYGMEEVDREGRVTFANRALGKILGYPVEELVGTYVWERQVTPDGQDGLRDYVHRLICEQPPPTPYRGVNITGDGRLITLQVDWDYRRDESGKVIGFVAILTDITQLERNREALQQAHDELEDRVRARTEQLAESNCRLQREIEQRRGAEWKEREAHRFLQSVIDALSAHVAVLDDQGRIVLINDAWRRFAEENKLQSPTHCLSENYLHVCDKATGLCSREAPIVAAGIRDVLAGRREGFYAEYPCHWFERIGEQTVRHPRWFQLRIGRFAHGDQTWVITAHENVTELKLTEQRLRDSEARYRSISHLVTNHAYSFAVDEDGTLENEWTSGHFEEITGFSTEELRARGGWRTLIHPDDQSIVANRVERLLAGEQDVSEFRIITKSGEVRWLRDYGQPILDERRKHVRRIVGAAQDITLRKQREEALRASEERFRLVFERSPLGIATGGPDGRILTANEAFCQMVGYTEDELRGMSIDALTHPDDLPLDKAAKEAVQQRRQTHYTIEKRYVHKDGHAVWAHVSATAVFNAQGEFGYGLVVVEDITDRKRTEEALRRAERLASIGTLAAGIAHEVNNPLHGIVLYSEAARLATDGTDGGATRDELLQKIQNEAMRCGQLVRSVLQFARQEASQKWPGAIDRIIRQSCDMALPLANQHGVKIDVELADSLPQAHLNPTEMQQVLVNLIHNAVQASEEGGHVIIRALANRGYVEIQVQDFGHGMDEAQRRQIFDPFFTTRQKRGGTGLGLSITHNIVRDHNGSIDVNSAVGEGTTISVKLPCAT